MRDLRLHQRFADSLVTLMLVRNGYRVFEGSHGQLQAFRGKEEFAVSVRSEKKPIKGQKKARFHAEVSVLGDVVRMSRGLAEKILHRDPSVQIILLED